MLKKLLGHGGMGVVWLAHDKRLQEPVALKFLPPQIGFDPAALEDLRRETLRARKLSHPNIIRIHDLHAEAGEIPFVSMEYVDGPNLHNLRALKPGRVLTWKVLAPMMRQLCAALAYAHSEKVVHRDLKPANLMLDSSGRLKLADFGLARVVQDSMTRLTGKTGGGTINFMSPQQADGRPPQVTDDIYSLGATLYDLLTSTPPFYTGDIAYQVRHVRPDDLRQRLLDLELENKIPSDVSALVMACLAKEPEQRPSTVASILAWLEAEEKAPGQAAPFVAPAPSAPVRSEPSANETAPWPESWPATPPPAAAAAHTPQVAPPRQPVEAEASEASVPAPRRSFPWLAFSGLLLVLLVVGAVGGAWLAKHWSDAAKKGSQPVTPAVPVAVAPRPATNMIIVDDEPRATKAVPDGSVDFTNLALVKPWVPAWTALPFLETQHSFPAHTGAVNALAFFPDRSALASVSDDGTIRVLDVNFDRPRWSQVAHDGGIKAVAVSADSRLLATSGADGSIRLWKANSGILITSLTGHTGAVPALAFSPATNHLASADDTGLVKLWDSESGAVIKEWSAHTGAVTTLSFNPQGSVLATAGEDKSVRLWNVPSGRRLFEVNRITLKQRNATVRCVAFSPNNNCLAIAGYAQSVETYAPDRQGYIGGVYYNSKDFNPKSLGFTPDARILVAAGDGNELSVLSQDAGGKPVKAKRLSIGAQENQIRCAVVSPDGAAAVCGLADGTIWVQPLDQIRREDGLEPVYHHPVPPGFVSIFNNTDLVGWQGNPSIWSVQNGVLVGHQPREIGRPDGAWNLTFKAPEAGDFELRFSFRLDFGGAGVFYRSHPLGSGRLSGYQFEIAGTNTGNLNLFREKSAVRLLAPRGGRSVVFAASAEELEINSKQPLELPSSFNDQSNPNWWNDAAIIAQDGVIEHYLNGVLVAQTTDNAPAHPRVGQIGLRLRGPGRVEFRDLHLKATPLPPAPAPITNAAPVPAPASLAKPDAPIVFAPSPGPGYERIFDGRTLQGWEGDPAGWSASEGLLKGSYPRKLRGGINRETGLVYQDRALEDFELRLSFRIVGWGGSVIYRGTPQPDWFVSGYEAGLGSGGGGTAFARTPEGATASALDPGLSRNTRAASGLWHTLQIHVQGHHIRHIFNGVVVRDFTDAGPSFLSKGCIALCLSPSGVVEFKDIWLKRLPARN